MTLNWTAKQARAAMYARAISCLSANMQVESFAVAIHQATNGKIALPAGLQQALIQEIARKPIGSQKPSMVLSTREQEVLALVIDELNNKAIAQRLYLSVRTVENHLAGIYQKS